jgi:glycerol-3-phosphate dehydrogenase (NAD(P)+)
MVAEGVRTSAAAVLLAQRAGVEMPIAERVAAVLFRGLAPREAIANLLARELKDETPL